MKKALENLEKEICQFDHIDSISNDEASDFLKNTVVALSVGGKGERLGSVTKQVINKNALVVNNKGESIVERIVSLIKELQNISSIKTSIGICTPGAISPATGMLKHSNTVCLIGKPLKEDIEKALKQKIEMENDANCFTLAETELGATKGYEVVFGVIIGTGVGGGIYINNSIHNGRMAIAGEWGHHTL